MLGNAAVNGARSAATAIFSGGDPSSALVLGAAKSQVDDIFNVAALQNAKKNASLEPDTLSGYAAPVINFLALEGGVYLIKYAPKTEQLRRIDDFFSKYGYAINKINAVSFTNRTVWDYIKTIDIFITGDIPQDDLQELKNIFNSGLTIWHDPSKIGDYSQTNTPTGVTP